MIHEPPPHIHKQSRDDDDDDDAGPSREFPGPYTAAPGGHPIGPICAVF